jgi:hypothetical protein
MLKNLDLRGEMHLNEQSRRRLGIGQSHWWHENLAAGTKLVYGILFPLTFLGKGSDMRD